MLGYTRDQKQSNIIYALVVMALVAVANIALAADEGADAKTLVPPECSGAGRAAKMACDPFSSLGLGENSSMMVDAMLQGGGQLAAQLSSGGKSAYEQCKSAANIAKIMGAVQATRAAACKVTQGRCIARCKESLEGLNCNSDPSLVPVRGAIGDQIGICENYERNFAMQLMQVMNNAQTFLGASQCAEMAKDAMTTPTPVDCKAAANANAAVCFCELHPEDPYCLGGQRDTGSGVGFVTNGSGSMVPNGRLKAVDRTGDARSGFDDGGGSGFGDGPSGGTSAKPIAGGGGGGPSSPFGGSGAYGPPPGGGSAGGIPSDASPSAISGVSGGGGFAGYGSPPGDEEGGRGRSGAYEKLKDKFNIKDALPGRSDRSLAGMSKDAAGDGITGANGPSIWEKVSRQYRKSESGLLRSPKK